MGKNRDVKGDPFAKRRLAAPENGSNQMQDNGAKNVRSQSPTPMSVTPDTRRAREKTHEPPAFPGLDPEAAQQVASATPIASAPDPEVAAGAPAENLPVIDMDDQPTFLGIVVARIWYQISATISSIRRRPDDRTGHHLSLPLRSTWSRFFPIFRPYAWVLLPLALILPLQLNNHLYYNILYGYDMPQHYNNTYFVQTTGTMPPAPMDPGTYEAFQAPLYYILTAWVIRAGNLFSLDAMRQTMPAALLVAAIVWTLLAAALIQRTMRRAHWLWRALTLAVIMLFPMNVQLSVMFNNDLPLTALGFWGVLTLWLMLRSGRLLDRGRWLRAAAIIGLCTAFKANGSILIAVYVLLTMYVCGLYVWERRFATAARVVRISLIGLPLMLVPFLVDSWHSSGYGTNVMGSQSEQYNLFSNQNITFFTSFDGTIFERPFGYGSGTGSYWTQQYITLHNDYLRFWLSDAYKTWPPSAMMPSSGFDQMPIELFNTAVILQYLAIPVTLVMAFAFFYALYRVIRKPYLALRDGSMVVVLVTVIAQGALLAAFYSYAMVQLSVIQARHLGFLYPFLFVVGMAYVWKLFLRRRNLFSALLSIFLSLNMVAYSYFALKLMWLPPNF